MGLLTEVEAAEATGKTAEIYQQAEQMMGYVPNALKMHSVNPPMLEHMWEYMGTVMNHPTLSGELFTCIRMLVSIRYQCEYCIHMNESMLINMSGYTLEQVAAIKQAPETAPLLDKEKALLAYVVTAVEDSNAVGETEIETLRAHGCSDVEIYDALKHGANQVAGDILLNAFKVELE
ncbi:MAG: hypothetical protein OQL16_11515 [Gammaproteobacteria bacterium]|nr:hypothetical protein [Gammaproteobacteria bacterium]